MSSLPPPGVKREPLAKSAPAIRAVTKAGISVGSAEPSASNMTMTSPVAAAKPQAMALPLPLRVWVIARTQGRVRRAAPIESSVECPSTTMISCTAGRTAAIAGSTTSRLRASLRVGTTTDTRGLPLRCIVVLPPPPSRCALNQRPPGTVHLGPRSPGTRGPDQPDRATPRPRECSCPSGPLRRDVTSPAEPASDHPVATEPVENIGPRRLMHGHSTTDPARDRGSPARAGHPSGRRGRAVASGTRTRGDRVDHDCSAHDRAPGWGPGAGGRPGARRPPNDASAAERVRVHPGLPRRAVPRRDHPQRPRPDLSRLRARRPGQREPGRLRRDRPLLRRSPDPGRDQPPRPCPSRRTGARRCACAGHR